MATILNTAVARTPGRVFNQFTVGITKFHTNPSEGIHQELDYTNVTWHTNTSTEIGSWQNAQQTRCAFKLIITLKLCIHVADNSHKIQILIQSSHTLTSSLVQLDLVMHFCSLSMANIFQTFKQMTTPQQVMRLEVTCSHTIILQSPADQGTDLYRIPYCISRVSGVSRIRNPGRKPLV